ncbi:hypothetical protein A2215_01545 [Candidatus Berkelbacteria bacterium RIFOXYA2_FULL_43_10]|uniref:Uncharacterized protein n=1 Tax=Candidatus Berkelbacteria bacterium RIFOXYA2_FULL_43_10 TaxID=1797472 RepID=A0A1F5E6V8_9BACT|nr:MAG: hypothetical protein A2215_01545 [Candidatus Berkelbacteria bacterium RIFOXYA2_FULL_43_10]
MYPHSTGWVIDSLYRAFGPSLAPAEYEETFWRDDIAIASHLVWMCRKVQSMTDRDKAGRWIGWVFASMQFRLKLMDNSRARDAARADAQLIKTGRSRPVPN